MTNLKIQLKIVRAFSDSKMSLRQLALASGVPYSTLWNLWNTNFNPNLDTVLALCRALKLEVTVQ